MSFANKVRATAKKAGSSPLFLVAAICLTLVQVLGFLSRNSVLNVLKVYSIFGQLGMPTPDLSAIPLVLGIVGMIPGLLITLGVWITYGSCARRKAKANTAGLMMIFVVNLVQLVCTCLVLLVAMMCIVFAIPKADLYAAIPEILPLKTILIGLLITVLVVFVLVLVYYIKLCTTISNVRSTLKTGVPNKRVSCFVAVMCYISGGLLIIGGIGGLMDAATAALAGLINSLPQAVIATEFFSALSLLLSAAVQIIFGALIFSYRSKMETLETEERLRAFRTLSHAEPYTAPVYIPPQPSETSAPVYSAPEPVTPPELDSEAVTELEVAEEPTA